MALAQSRKFSTGWQRPPDEVRLKLNFLQSSYLTRLITCLVPKSMYDANESRDLYTEMLEVMAQSLDELLMSGMCDKHGVRHRICVIGVKGDWPYLARVGAFQRAYNRAANGGASGICHRCLAGRPGVDAEEVGSRRPAWLSTLGVEDPWREEPVLTRYLPHIPEDAGSFYHMDVWHTYHLGIGRSFASSVIVLMIWEELFPAANIDQKFKLVTESYLSFCKMSKQQPHVTKITPSFVGYRDKAGINGTWNKGALTTVLMLWLENCLSSAELGESSVLHKALLATRHINSFFRCLYNADAFLDGPQCAYVSCAGRAFLRLCLQLAETSYVAGRPLFPLLPKLHSLDHFVVKLHWDGVNHALSENPLQTACQLDEDAIGHLSRLSRRVSVRLVVRRTFERYLAAAHDAWSRAKWI